MEVYNEGSENSKRKLNFRYLNISAAETKNKLFCDPIIENGRPSQVANSVKIEGRPVEYC